MKQFLLILLVTLACQLTAITITKADYGWNAGNIRNYLEGGWNQSTTDLTSGTGKIWNFTTPSEGYQNTTIFPSINVTSFPNADIYHQNVQSIMGYATTINVYYQETVDDFVELGHTGISLVLIAPGLPSGLPHYLNKSWQGSYYFSSSSINETQNYVGDVIAEGMLTTHWGTHQALLVRYSITGPSDSYQFYQWETLEYGIEVFCNTISGGLLYVLNEAEPNIVANDDLIASPTIPAVTVYPNPSRDIVNLQVSTKLPGNLDVSIYNIKGELVHQEKQIPSKTIVWNGKNKNQEKVKPGVYFYRINEGKQTATGKFVIVQ